MKCIEPGEQILPCHSLCAYKLHLYNIQLIGVLKFHLLLRRFRHIEQGQIFHAVPLRFYLYIPLIHNHCSPDRRHIVNLINGNPPDIVVFSMSVFHISGKCFTYLGKMTYLILRRAHSKITAIGKNKIVRRISIYDFIYYLHILFIIAFYLYNKPDYYLR
mgnify:CR=1 FL=1